MLPKSVVQKTVGLSVLVPQGSEGAIKDAPGNAAGRTSRPHASLPVRVGGEGIGQGQVLGLLSAGTLAPRREADVRSRTEGYRGTAAVHTCGGTPALE